MVQKQLLEILAKHGVEPIAAQGIRSIPTCTRRSCSSHRTSIPRGPSSPSISKGYKIRDRVLRPSKVAVSVKPGHEKASERMPTYDYICDSCGHEFEAYESIMAPPRTDCPECKLPKLRRKIGPGAAILFKGSGFYQTDYRSDSYKKAAQADKSSSEPAKANSNRRARATEARRLQLAWPDQERAGSRGEHQYRRQDQSMIRAVSDLLEGLRDRQARRPAVVPVLLDRAAA